MSGRRDHATGVAAAPPSEPGVEPTDDETTSDETTDDRTTGDRTTGDRTTGDETTDDQAPRTEEGPAADAAGHKPWGWHAIRVSGLFLSVLLVWHVLVTFVLNDVGQTTAVTVSNHWRDTTWRGLEWVTLVLALAHGGLGTDALARRWLAAKALPPWSVMAARVANGLVVAGLATAATSVVLSYR